MENWIVVDGIVSERQGDEFRGALLCVKDNNENHDDERRCRLDLCEWNYQSPEAAFWTAGMD